MNRRAPGSPAPSLSQRVFGREVALLPHGSTIAMAKVIATPSPISASSAYSTSPGQRVAGERNRGRVRSWRLLERDLPDRTRLFSEALLERTSSHHRGTAPRRASRRRPTLLRTGSSAGTRMTHVPLSAADRMRPRPDSSGSLRRSVSSVNRASQCWTDRPRVRSGWPAGGLVVFMDFLSMRTGCDAPQARLAVTS
jgi:hypothetical protein